MRNNNSVSGLSAGRERRADAVSALRELRGHPGMVELFTCIIGLPSENENRNMRRYPDCDQSISYVKCIWQSVDPSISSVARRNAIEKLASEPFTWECADYTEGQMTWNVERAQPVQTNLFEVVA